MKMENKSTGKEEKLEPISKEQVEELLKKYSINLEKDAGYDSVYVANMAKSDYYKSSLLIGSSFSSLPIDLFSILGVQKQP